MLASGEGVKYSISCLDYTCLGLITPGESLVEHGQALVPVPFLYAVQAAGLPSFSLVTQGTSERAPCLLASLRIHFKCSGR